jgi:hypothetical protein
LFFFSNFFSRQSLPLPVIVKSRNASQRDHDGQDAEFQEEGEKSDEESDVDNPKKKSKGNATRAAKEWMAQLAVRKEQRPAAEEVSVATAAGLPPPSSASSISNGFAPSSSGSDGKLITSAVSSFTFSFPSGGNRGLIWMANEQETNGLQKYMRLVNPFPGVSAIEQVLTEEGVLAPNLNLTHEVVYRKAVS